MMKQIVMVLLLLGCTFSALAADKVTPEFKNLQAIRAKKIKEIDTAYVKALEKLKLKCTRKGDLVSANAINIELQRVKSAPLAKTGLQNHQTSKQTKDLPRNTKTLKVDEGSIAFIHDKKVSFKEAQERAKELGGQFYFPLTHQGTRQMLRLIPEGKDCWLNISSKLVDGKLKMEMPDGLEFDYEKVTRLEPASFMIGLNQQVKCYVHVDSRRQLRSIKDFNKLDGFILLMPTK